MARKLTSCKTELRISYSNTKRNISQQDKEKTIHSKLKNTFALVFRISVLERRSECHKKHPYHHLAY